jgi:nitrite reductase/ring-hydroxylating ferredoxin subunit
MTEQIRLTSVHEIPSGTGREYVAADRVLAVFHLDGQFHVLDGICPHAGGPLANGTLQGCVVTCPWHGWQFDVTTGRHQLTPRIAQRRYRCELEGDDLLVDLSE